VVEYFLGSIPITAKNKDEPESGRFGVRRSESRPVEPEVSLAESGGWSEGPETVTG
jgi:hypothetical protein